MRSSVIVAAMAMTFAVHGAVAAPAPQLAVQSLSQLSDLPYPFDPDRDAKHDVAAASARAAAQGKLLLIDLGANWCPECRILSGVMALPRLGAFLAAHYVIVTVDVGRLDRNLDIPARYGVTMPLTAVPALLVVDPKTNALIDRGQVFALMDLRSLTPQTIADWLAKWTR